MRKIFTATALCAGLSLGSTAYASNNLTIDIGSVSANQTFSQVIQKSQGYFSDTWTFSVVEDVFSGGSVSNLSIKLPSLTLFNISSLSAQLYDGLGNMLYNLDLDPASTADIKVGSGYFPIGSGYSFAVSGFADGAFGGQYVFAVSTLPVPEPETYAMMLAGLGLIGAVARRRMKREG